MTDPHTKLYDILVEQTGLNITPKVAGVIADLVSSERWNDLIEMVRAVSGAVAEDTMQGNPKTERDYLINFGMVRGVNLFIAKAEEVASAYKQALTEDV